MSLTINPLSDQLEERYGTKIDELHKAIQPVAEMGYLGGNGITRIKGDDEDDLDTLKPGREERYRASTDEEAAELHVRFDFTQMDFTIDARESLPPQVAAGLRKVAKRLLRAARRAERVEDWR